MKAKFEKQNRQKPLTQFQLFIFYETRLSTEKFSRTTTIHPGIFGGRALWADSGPLRMSTIAPRDQFKPIRIGENLVVNYNCHFPRILITSYLFTTALQFALLFHKFHSWKSESFDSDVQYVKECHSALIGLMHFICRSYVSLYF